VITACDRNTVPGMDESAVTKLQTGGPDGDLGSNEILVSHDKTIAIVDGSGVLCDRRCVLGVRDRSTR
jgi:NAD-specific glutamate dehydrogenase